MNIEQRLLLNWLAGIVLVTCCAMAAGSQAEDLETPTDLATDAIPQKDEVHQPTGSQWALFICGLPGDDEHHALYAETIESLHTSLTRLGVPAENIRVQFGDEPTADDGPAVSAA